MENLMRPLERMEYETFQGDWITPSSQAAREENRHTLVKSGRLRDSLSGPHPEGIRRIQGNMITFGTMVPYAGPLQFGGLSVQSRISSRGKVFTRVSEMPPRPFVGFIIPDAKESVKRELALNIISIADKMAGTNIAEGK
jgi:phage gpG-like protein